MQPAARSTIDRADFNRCIPIVSLAVGATGKPKRGRPWREVQNRRDDFGGPNANARGALE